MLEVKIKEREKEIAKLYIYNIVARQLRERGDGRPPLKVVASSKVKLLTAGALAEIRLSLSPLPAEYVFTYFYKPRVILLVKCRLRFL